MKLQRPSLGRIVHYLAERTGKPVMAAMIIKIHDTHPDQAAEGLVDLNVFHPNSGGGHLVPGVKFSRKELKDGCWWWPSRVEDVEVLEDGKAYEPVPLPPKPKVHEKHAGEKK